MATLVPSSSTTDSGKVGDGEGVAASEGTLVAVVELGPGRSAVALLAPPVVHAVTSSKVASPTMMRGRNRRPLASGESEGLLEMPFIVPTLSLEGSSNLRKGWRPDFRREASVTVAGLCRILTGFAAQADRY
jgi:hypothetical protein